MTTFFENLNDKYRKLKGILDTIPKNAATRTSIGWIGIKDKLIIDTHGNYANGVSENSDPLTMEHGYYAGRNFKNVPEEVDNTICFLRIEGYKDYRKLTFTQPSGWRYWERYIYPGVNDSGWIDTHWVNCVTKNGFTGTAKARILPNNLYSAAEIRFDLTGSFKKGASPIDVITLPDGYTSADPNIIYGTGVGKYTTNQGYETSTPLGFAIHKGNLLEIFHTDSNDVDLTSAAGQIFLTKGDSTIK